MHTFHSLTQDEILELQRKKKRDEAYYKHEAELKASTSKWKKMMYGTEYLEPESRNEDYRFFTSQETF
jgi:hypothetical protein